MSSAGGPKDRRGAAEEELPGRSCQGEVEAAIELLRETLEWVGNPTEAVDLIGYLEKRRSDIPDPERRQRAGSWIASTRVEKFNDRAVFGSVQAPGNELVAGRSAGLGGIGIRETQGELDEWRRVREVPGRPSPGPVRKAA